MTLRHSLELAADLGYAPVAVLPAWLQALSPLSPMTYILRSVRVALLEGGGLAMVAGDLLILAVMGAVLVPGGLLIFVKPNGTPSGPAA